MLVLPVAESRLRKLDRTDGADYVFIYFLRFVQLVIVVRLYDNVVGVVKKKYEIISVIVVIVDYKLEKPVGKSVVFKLAVPEPQKKVLLSSG